MSKVSQTVPRTAGPAASPVFTEGPAWLAVGRGWCPLFGGYREVGFSFEWHEFTCREPLDWARSFHPGSVELCLNLNGVAALRDAQQAIELSSKSYAFYRQGEPSLAATRRAGESHRFITVEFSPDFLGQHFRALAEQLHPLIRAVVRDETRAAQVASPERINSSLLQLVESLRYCPVFHPAREMWFRCKALELASHLFFQPAEGELFCTRTQRAARERIEKAKAILCERLIDPPSLDELGRLVGCSPSYLSRQFSAEQGATIQQFLQQVRLERAAELIGTGKCNVTEAAFAVGYSSLSHFSTVFREVFGCCPGLYPLQTLAQKKKTT